MVQKRTAIIGICVTILVTAIIVSALIARKTDDKSQENDDEFGKSDSLKAVEQICHRTHHQEACGKSLSASLNSFAKPHELIKVALDEALKETGNALENLVIFGKNSRDPIIAEELKTCEKLLNDSMDDIQRSFDRVDPFSLNEVDKTVDDLKTWLTGAQTYQETCLDTLENANDNSGEKMKTSLKKSISLISNGLALVNEVSKIMPASGDNSFNRKLLSETEGMKHRLLHATPPNIKPNVTVAKDGSVKYTTINEALKEVPLESNETFVIYVKEGVYQECVTISRKMQHVTLIGDGPTKTRITGKKSQEGALGTYLAATVGVEGDHFIARNIGFENTAGPKMHQAVALRVTADQSIFHNCRIDGYQNTLYIHNHRQFYRDCTISGTVDIIFGNARAVFQNCKLILKKPVEDQKAFSMTAQGRFEADQASGIILQNCEITSAPDFPMLNKSFTVYLSRPWKKFSRTIVLDSKINGVINTNGWTKLRNEQILDACWYTEFGSNGIGANQSKKTVWEGFKKMSQQQALEFTPGKYFLGDYWIKNSGVPYISGRISK